jgi:hypothetical protein
MINPQEGYERGLNQQVKVIRPARSIIDLIPEKCNKRKLFNEALMAVFDDEGAFLEILLGNPKLKKLYQDIYNAQSAKELSSKFQILKNALDDAEFQPKNKQIYQRNLEKLLYLLITPKRSERRGCMQTAEPTVISITNTVKSLKAATLVLAITVISRPIVKVFLPTESLQTFDSIEYLVDVALVVYLCLNKQSAELPIESVQMAHDQRQIKLLVGEIQAEIIKPKLKEVLEKFRKSVKSNDQAFLEYLKNINPKQYENILKTIKDFESELKDADSFDEFIDSLVLQFDFDSLDSFMNVLMDVLRLYDQYKESQKN